eukprot:CCRYP_005775-RA/>CCRYP_005775-RA protein AED:0.88 eAED:0.88 QI:0/-1/0/1/-1/1/1/0/161
MNITASLSTADFDLQGSSPTDPTNITTDTTGTANSAPPAADSTRNPSASEIARLQAEIARLRQQQSTSTPSQPSNLTQPTTTGDTSLLRLLADNQRMMQEQQQAFLQALQTMQANAVNMSPTTPLSTVTPLTKPTIDFPSCDGHQNTKPDFLFRLATMKKD